MRTASNRISLVTLVIGLLIVLLPLLAALQYRWLGQVSAAERGRLQENWRVASAEFGRDFNRELARAFLHFQQHVRSSPGAPLDKYARRHAEWIAEGAVSPSHFRCLVRP